MFQLIKFFSYFFLYLYGKNSYINLHQIICNYNLNPKVWSIYGSVDNFNIAFPDVSALYAGSFICLNKNESIKIKSQIPFARYYSIQIYDSKAVSLGSLNDHQIIVENNEFEISIQNKKKPEILENLKNNLYIDTNDTFLILLFRVYDVDKNMKSGEKIFGWIDKPIIIKNNFTLPSETNYTKIILPRIYVNKKPEKEIKYANEENNFFKPYSNGYFSNNDADYLVSIIDLETNKSSEIVGIITGYLPIISKYNINNLNSHFNKTYYEVRYVSFNMGTLSRPFPTTAGEMFKSYYGNVVNGKLISSTGKPGITDIDIIKRYSNESDSSWEKNNRKYKIYIAKNLDQIRKVGGDPDVDLYMLYPIDQRTKKPFSFPVIIFRHLMSQEKFLNDPKFKNGIGSINSSFASPNECENKMEKYYPLIKFINL